jgi:iron complex transport system substrate-binding protein
MATDHSPRRIACLQPSATEILHALGRLDCVVACTKYCAAVVPEIAARNVIVLHDSWTADMREIFSARSDLVIAAVPYQEKALGEILRAGVRLLALSPRTLKDIYGDIVVIAALVDASDQGRSLIASMREHVEGVRRRTASLPRRRVFCEEWGKPLIASQPWVAELIEAAGGEFLGEPGRQILSEEIVRLDPDVLIAAWCGAGNRVPLEKIIAQREWGELAAVRARSVYCLPDEHLNTPSPSLMRGLDALASCLHPESFPSVEGTRRIADLPWRDLPGHDLP